MATQFNLEWEGKVTPNWETRTPLVTPDQVIPQFAYPFHLSIRPYPMETGFHGLLVTAKYMPGDIEPVEIDKTNQLDPEELEPILRGQIDNIRESAQR